MSDPNEKQKCWTCPGCGKSYPSECDWCSNILPKPSCAPRGGAVAPLDGSAAEVKRYRAWWTKHGVEISEDVCGDWCRYLDVADVVAERDALHVREAALVADRNEMLSRARAAEDRLIAANLRNANEITRLAFRVAELETDMKAAFHELGGIGEQSSLQFHRVGIDSARGILSRALSKGAQT